MKFYQKQIELINAIDWTQVNPKSIIEVSLFFAKEFATTTRACMPKYGAVPAFQEFIEGEIDTDNLQYADYHEKADHWKFIAHFVEKKNISIHSFNKNWEETTYTSFLGALFPEMKLVTLVSREKELQGIFQKILMSHDWDALGYGFYKYFLERHLELDGAEGGHEDLMEQLVDLSSLTEEQDYALRIFWKLRYEVYELLMN